MKSKNLAWMVGLFLLIGFLIPLRSASADIGPKPTFEFVYDFSVLSSPPEIEGVILYLCRDQNCTEKMVLPEVPGQKLKCGPVGCNVSLMMGGVAWQVEIVLGEKSLVSAPFEKEGFYSIYSLKISEDHLSVILLHAKDRGVPGPGTGSASFVREAYLLNFLNAGLFTLVIELPLAVLILLLSKSGIKNILWVLLGNLITIPIVWYLLPLIIKSPLGLMIAVFITAASIEAILLAKLGGEKIGWGKAWTISILINIASTLFGLYIFLYLF